MAKTNKIKSKFFDEGKNFTTIAREAGYTSRRVLKYIHKKDKNKESTNDPQSSELDPFKLLIDQWTAQCFATSGGQQSLLTCVYAYPKILTKPNLGGD